MSIKIQINASELAADFKDLRKEIEQEIQQGVKTLATITHAKIAEMAHSELKSSQKQYLDNLNIESITENLHVITLDEKAMWIEDGIDPNTDMKPELLKNPDGTSKNGYKYKVIPFKYSDKTSTNSSPNTQGLVDEIKNALSKKNVSMNKIERNPNGSPKLGKLHTIDIPSGKPGKGNTPVLQGVNVYQSQDKAGKVRRDVLTFRTVSSGPASADKFIYPGLKKKEFFERAEKWCLDQWETAILPEILKNFK